MILGMSLRPRALALLELRDPAAKAEKTRALFAAVQLGQVVLDSQAELATLPCLPGRPSLPRLVAATEVPRRSPFTPQGRAALIHSICHI